MPQGEGRALVIDNYGDKPPLAAVRALARGGFSPVVAASGSHSLAAASRYCKTVIAAPPVTAAGFRKAIDHMSRARQFVAVLPASDDAIEALGLPEAQLLDKGRLAKRAMESGLMLPPSVIFSSGEALLDGSSELDFPVVVKPLRGKPATFAAKQGDLMRWRVVSTPLMVQPFLTHGMWSISGVVWRGRLMAAVHQRYLRIWPPNCGGASAAETIDPDEETERRVLSLVAEHNGIFQAQFSGQYLLDLNPRVYGSMSLAVEAGANLPAIYCALLQGREIAPCRGRSGVFYRWLDGDVRSIGRGLWRRELTAGRGAAALLPRRHAAHGIESIRDPQPLIAQLSARLTRMSRRLRGPNSTPQLS